MKFAWTSDQHTAFNTLKSALLEAPMLHQTDPSKHYIVYTDASDDSHGLSCHSNMMAKNFLLHFSPTLRDTQWKWSTTEQEAYGIYYAVKKWNYYLQGSDIVAYNNHKPLQKFLNDNNADTKINRWSAELTTYNMTFEWISGAHNKAADCLS